MYLDFFKLGEFPFNITPDPRFLFFSARHRAAYDHMLYGIRQRKGFIELTGEVGCGKTTLTRAVLSELNDSVETALILNPDMTETQLLRAILSDFGLEPRGNDRLAHLEKLNRFLLERSAQGRNVALIIDEAQDLSSRLMEQVRLLSNLETDQYKLIQIILCGQPELKERLRHPSLRQLRQRITVRYHLQALSRDESAHYIQHRLTVAGPESDVQFTPAAVREIHRYAKGCPRMINNVCDNSLLAGYVANVHNIDADCVKRAIQQLEG